jgi:hypothetical protein
MGKLNFTKPIVRETEAELEYNDDSGALQKEKVTIRFQSLNTTEIRARRQTADDRRKKDQTYWLAEELVGILLEIIESDGTTHAATSELLDGMSTDNLKAIQTAIDNAITPKEPAGK